MASLILSIDAMGGDAAPTVVLDGLKLFAAQRQNVLFEVHGRAEDITAGIETRGLMDRCTIFHHDDVVDMSEKPSVALRRAKTTSMWGAVQAVKAGRAGAAVSAGNTGALMAFAMMSLRKMEGVHRPAMTAIWPTMEGRSVVLDVGANLDADSDQLVTFAIMGEAYARAVTGKAKPTIGLLNIGAEDGKGRDTLKLAAERLRESELGLDFRGYIEGNDIALGAVDVVVTDGFTGNVALKTMEGTAMLITHLFRRAFRNSPLSMLGYLLARGGLRTLRAHLDPNTHNGGMFVGLNGLVVKSHGSANAAGIASAISVARDLAQGDLNARIAEDMAGYGSQSAGDTTEAAVQ